MDTERVKQFFDDTWSTYARVVAHNYMFHREIYGAVREAIQGLVSGPFSLLDLGSGDSAPIASALSALPIARYVAVDLSETALALGARRLEALHGSKEFVQADLGSAIDTLAGPFDVILLGFSLHHLSQASKRSLLERALGQIGAHGAIIVADVFRSGEETREHYISRYLTRVKTHWALLEAAQQRELMEHITQSDFPESEPGFVELVRTLGAHARPHFSAEDGFHRVVVITRSPH